MGVGFRMAKPTRMAQSAGMDLLNLVPAAAAAGQMGIATEGPGGGPSKIFASELPGGALYQGRVL